MKTYCVAPFRQVYADNAGRYRLCCHADDHPDLKKYNTNNTLPFDFFFSEEMENIRDAMLSGERIKGCETCYKMEDRGHPSWRQLKYNNIYDTRTEVSEVSLKLRVNGSYCNLGCYMCFPYNSSTRRAELKSKDIDWSYYDEKGVNVSNSSYDKIVNNILDHIQYVKYINITGGEPLQLPRMWQFLDSIPDKHAKNITLLIDTNLTKLQFKEWNIFEVAKRFDVKLGVSCDHYGDKLHWIRYPIDVIEFENNLKSAKDIVANVNVTVSILNILDLYEIRNYYKDYQVQFVNINRDPKMLSIRNLPQKLKDELKVKYKNMPMVIQELDNDIIPGELEKGLDYCRKLNQMRNINFDSLFAEFIDAIHDL